MRATIPGAIEIITKIERETPNVLAESSQVHQIVTNLVTNAWHAIGDKQGAINLQLAAFPVDEDFARTHPDLRPGRYVRLSISDNGHGIPQETVDRIFEPFFTTKAPGEGTGLGLSVVHGLMKSFDGAITVYSEPKSGTSFHLYFPALDFSAAASPEENLGEPLGHGERILFVDDEPVLAMLGERFLQRLGYTPVVQTDPHTALASFQDQPFDMVVTDLTMPHLSGLEFARRLWAIRPETRVVLTTGFSATLDQARARELGFRELLLKPYGILGLGQVLERTLNAAPEPTLRR